MCLDLLWVWPCIVVNTWKLKRPTRCNRLVSYCKTYCSLNMFWAPICQSSGAQEWWQLSSTSRKELVLFHCWWVLIKPVPSWTCLKDFIKNAWHTPVPNVQWKTPDDEQRNCSKHVEVLDKNKLGKIKRLLVLLKRYISLICDKSIRTQNLAFWSYWYRKKRLQMQF